MVPPCPEDEDMGVGTGRGRGKYNRKKSDVDGSVEDDNNNDNDNDNDDDNDDSSNRRKVSIGRKYNLPLQSSQNDFSPRPNARVRKVDELHYFHFHFYLCCFFLFEFIDNLFLLFFPLLIVFIFIKLF